MFLEKLHATWLRLKAIGRRRRLDRDLEEELAFHLAMREEKNRASGLDLNESRAGSRRQFGSVTRMKELCRELWTFHFWETLLQDLRYALRILIRNSVFTAVAILTLALGIGVNTAIFSLTYQLFLKQLAVQHPEELVILRSPGLAPGSYHSDGDVGVIFSLPMYKELRDQNQVFSGLVARYPFPLSIAGAGFTERGNGELVSGNYFQVLGVQPALGRVFSQDDDTTAGANAVAVLSYGYWMRRFGGNSAVLNRQLNVNGTALTVVGVAQSGFSGVQIGQWPDIFVPLSMKAQMTPNWNGMEERGDHWLAIIGRLRRGFTATQAQAGLQAIYRSFLQEDAIALKVSEKNRQRFLSKALVLDPGVKGRQVLQRYAQQPMLMMEALVGLVLLITCANLAGLLIAKGESRRREVAVRLSLGAGRGRVVRQLLTESLVLSLLGGIAGLGFALWTLRLMVGTISQAAGVIDLRDDLDLRVLLFTFALSVLTAVLFGLAPAMRLVRSDPQAALKSQGAMSGAGSVRLRKGLIVFQVAVTVLLLAIAGLFARSLLNIEHAGLGLEADRVIQFSIQPELSRYTPAQTVALVDRLQSNIAAIPGVGSASAAVVPILEDSENSDSINVSGYMPHENEDTYVEENWIGPGYFSTMKIPLIAGREFSGRDIGTSPKVAVVNQALVRHYFAHQDAIGAHFTLHYAGRSDHSEIEIVGVAADSKHDSVRDPVHPFVYMPYSQLATFGSATFYVRTRQAPENFGAAMTQAVAAIDPALPVFAVKTLREQVSDSLLVERLLAVLCVCAASLASLLAGIGLYGVMAYVVARRTREIGIRIALGASRTAITGMVMRELSQMAALGMSIGLVLTLIIGRLLNSLLFGVGAANPLVLALAAGFLATVALLAGSLPARTAARIEPIAALRCE
ncbi:MAG TPA: ABC transporter permease [Candidatus Angelobacter sp.]|nr:ABC transporter permease [Candidatus Angelobacter sp.]